MFVFLPNSNSNLRKNNTPPLLTVLLYSCALSLLVLSLTLGRYCCGYYFHFIDEDTEAQRLACSSPAKTDKARNGAQVFWCQAPAWQFLCKVVDNPISQTAWLGRSKSKMKKLTAEGKFSSQKTKLVSEFSSLFCFSSSSVTSLLFTRLTHLPTQCLNCHLVEELLSKGLLSPMEGDMSLMLDSPLSCDLTLLSCICQAGCEHENYPSGEYTITQLQSSLLVIPNFLMFRGQNLFL
jgi:hypothetical protein